MSSARGAALYIGALLGPSLLLLPGLAAALAGPASIVAWSGLLILSGLLAWVFTSLGTRIRGGVAEYAAAGLGARVGRVVGWCFLSGVVAGAPVVCLIGGGYIADLVGGGKPAKLVAAAALLLTVVALTLRGARSSTAVQLVLVAVLVLLVAVAVIGSAPAGRAENWLPFAPHGWSSIGAAGSVLMLSFVGWEAIAPLTGRLRDPRTQLPRVIGTAFAITTVIYLALAAATISVLGTRAPGEAPLADLLEVAVGAAGPVIGTTAAVTLTLAATNAYLTSAAVLTAQLRGPASSSRGLQLAVLAAGLVLLGAAAADLVSTAQLVSIPTTLFLVVYLCCTAASVRVLSGPVRAAAAVACAAVLGVLAFSGWALLVASAVAIRAAVAPERRLAPVGGAAPEWIRSSARELRIRKRR
ncbi:amino acid efflux transporter [Saccharopolyspora antimicrobica]|uniref:Amino acid efflux transporter n=2 Tax=Saccharopolyspora antimicrobica TaxID=455193 RepID=A0A1I4THP9_9PSEU|nr:amino acid exporter (AAE family) [Saccharopolyspora antimicrobica]SFM76222.1 amino acid efflux transporter [Saccharopolyspora antimicrobica]